MKPCGVAIQMKATDQCVPLVVFVSRYFPEFQFGLLSLLILVSNLVALVGKGIGFFALKMSLFLIIGRLLNRVSVIISL